MPTISEAEQRINCAAEFLPAQMAPPGDGVIPLPVVRLAGVMVSVYLQDGRLQVSIDPQDADADLIDPLTGTVGIDVSMNGHPLTAE